VVVAKPCCRRASRNHCRAPASLPAPGAGACYAGGSPGLRALCARACLELSHNTAPHLFPPPHLGICRVFGSGGPSAPAMYHHGRAHCITAIHWVHRAMQPHISDLIARHVFSPVWQVMRPSVSACGCVLPAALHCCRVCACAVRLLCAVCMRCAPAKRVRPHVS
jgi:hypothetical protein